MGIKTILLLCATMQLIGVVYLHECPTYEKHVALRNNLLNYRAVCRAAKYGFEDKICLNGLKPDGYNCTVGSSNDFHCLTGDDNVDQEKDYDLKCDSIAYDERQKLCKYYSDQIENKKRNMGVFMFWGMEIFPGLLFIPQKSLRQAVWNLLYNNTPIEDYVNSSCPVMGWKVSEM